jgi:hypothetical protein
VAEGRRAWMLMVVGTVIALTAALLVLTDFLGSPPELHRREDQAGVVSAAGSHDRPAEDVSAEISSSSAAEARSLNKVGIRVLVASASDGRRLREARVSVRRHGALIDQGVTGSDGLWSGIVRASPGPVELRVQADDHEPDRRTLMILEGVDAEVTVSLAHIEGWRGRVVTELGDPLPGVPVILRRVWPARPASVWDGGPLIVARPTEVSAAQRLVTDKNGEYFVPALPRGEAVELQLSVGIGELTSEVMRIPLPLSFGMLPDLPARGARWLTGVVVDGDGEPLPGAQVRFDPAPGPWRERHDEDFAGAAGGFTMKLGGETRHVQAAAPGYWLVGASAGDEPLQLVSGAPRPWARSTALEAGSAAGARSFGQRVLPADEPAAWHASWAAIPPATGAVTLTLERSARLEGVARSYETGRPLSGARASVRHDGTLLAVAWADGEGAFSVELPPDWAATPLDLSLDHPGAERLEQRVYASQEPNASLGALSLRWAPPDEAVKGSLSLGGFWLSRWQELGGVELEFSASRWSGTWLPEGELPDQRDPGWQRLAPPLWDGLEFQFAERLQLGESLVVMARAITREGEQHVGWWGPHSVLRARTEGVALRLLPPAKIDYSVSGVPEGERAHVTALSWDPWLDRVHASRRTLMDSIVGPVRSSGSVWVPPIGVHTLELRQDRAPIHRLLAGLAEWVEIDSYGETPVHDLAHPGRHAVSGTVVWHGADGWPETCVALLGEGAPDWRLHDLGAWDSWARPDQHGRFRFEDVPGGDHAFVLYRPAGDHAVEILAERSVTVKRDLFNLDIWAEAPDAPLRRVVVSPWGVAEGDLPDDLAAR